VVVIHSGRIFRGHKDIETHILTLLIKWIFLVILLSTTPWKHCTFNQVPQHEDWGVEVHLHAFLTLALVGGMWSVSYPIHFTPWGRRPWCPFDRGIGGPQKWSEWSTEEEKALSPDYWKKII
jgi:hypothetical protein